MQSTVRAWYQRERDEVQKACSCHKVAKSTNCRHLDALFGNQDNLLRIASMNTRRVEPCSETEHESRDVGGNNDSDMDEWTVEPVKVDGNR